MKKALIADWYYVMECRKSDSFFFNNIWDDFDHYALITPAKDRSLCV
jgi:hypothetical protein